MPATDHTRFYLRWIAANGWAEAAGLGTTFVLGRTIAPLLDEVTAPVAVIGGAMAVVAVGIVLEGVVVGWAQARVLRSRLADLVPRTWVLATAAGAGVAWAVGMVPSTVMALVADPSPTSVSPPPELPLLAQYSLAALLGAVTGPILGLVQWVVLRRHVARAGAWLGANAAAWAIGMPIIFIGMDLVPWDRSPIAVSSALYGVCAAAGLAVGVVHGRVIARLTSRD